MEPSGLSPYLVRKYAINTIIIRIKVPIQRGANTHNQDQLITPMSLSTMNTIVNNPLKPIPELEPELEFFHLVSFVIVLFSNKYNIFL